MDDHQKLLWGEEWISGYGVCLRGITELRLWCLLREKSGYGVMVSALGMEWIRGYGICLVERVGHRLWCLPWGKSGSEVMVSALGKE